MLHVLRATSDDPAAGDTTRPECVGTIHRAAQYNDLGRGHYGAGVANTSHAVGDIRQR